MAITEFYVSTAGNAAYGGSSGGTPKKTGSSWSRAAAVITATNIGASPVVTGDYVYLTSGGYGFGSPGNWFRIDVITNDNTVTVHTAPYNASGGTWNVGGSLDFASALTLIAPGFRFNIKNDGTYSLTTAATNLAVSGTSANYCYWRGYKTTITDGYQGRSSQTGNLVTTNMPTLLWTTGYLANQGRNCWSFENIQFESAKNGTTIQPGGFTILRNCTIKNTNNTADTPYALYIPDAGTKVINCDCYLTASTGASAAIGIWGNGNVIVGGKITSTALGVSYGTSGSQSTLTISNTLFYNCVVGIKEVYTTVTNGYSVFNCTFYNCTTSAILRANIASTANINIHDTIITDCGRAIDSLYYGTGNVPIYTHNLRTRNNTNANRGYDTTLDFNPITTDNGTDFEDAANGDFRLKTGSPCIGAALNGGDLGAYQRPEAAAAVYTAATNVRYGTDRGDGVTGTCYVPTAANTLFGVNVDNTTGTYKPVAATDVRYGTNVGITTGTCYVPSPEDVREDVPVDDTVGSLTASNNIILVEDYQ